MSQSGFFVLTNSPGSVVWGSHYDGVTNKMEFILVVPETAGIGDGAYSQGYESYLYFDLKLKHNDHQWKIQTWKNFKTGIRWMRLTDLTAGSASNVDLEQGRFWRVSEDGVLTSLDHVDETISAAIARESSQLHALHARNAGFARR